MEQQQFGEPREEGFFEESIDVRHYWHIILERRWLVVATFAVVMVLSVFYLFTATTIFSSTTRLQIDSETANSLQQKSLTSEASRGWDYHLTQHKNLTSRSLKKMVAKEMQENANILHSINADKARLDQLAEASGLDSKKVEERLHDIAAAGFFGPKGYSGGNAPALAKEENKPITPGSFAFLTMEQKDGETTPPHLDSLTDRISVLVKPVRGSRLVDVSSESPNRNEAALIANTVVAKFLEQDNARKRGKLTNAVDFLQKEAANLSDKVRDNFGALLSYKKDNDIISLEESQNVTLKTLIQAQTAYDTAHSSEVSAAAVAGEADRVFKETKQYGTVPDVAIDAEVRTIRGNLALTEAELAELLKRYLEKHPKIIEKRARIESLAARLASSERRIFNSIVTQAQLAAAKALSLKGVLTIRKSEQQAMNQKSIQYYALEREAKQSETLYSLALSRLKETELQEKDIVQNMHVIDKAIAGRKIRPKKC